MGWEDNVRTVTPYVPGEQTSTKVIKLNTNENPYPPSDKVKIALENMDIDKLRLYPDVNGGELRHRLAQKHGLEPEQVFLGVGSDEVLALAFLTFFNGKNPVLVPDITYSFYQVWAELFGIKLEQVLLDKDFRLKKEDYYYNTRPNSGIVIANPNAPTGMEISLEDIEDIVAGNRESVVIIDEAYVDFGGVTAIPLIGKYDNLLVVQTFSKSRALAGARIGMAFGSSRLIRYLNDVKFSFNSYTMNRLSVAVAEAMLEDEEYFLEQTARIINTREYFTREIKKMGFVTTDSRTNFVFTTHPDFSAADIFAKARERGILLRYFNKPGIDNYLRITIGTREEMDILLQFLREYIKG